MNISVKEFTPSLMNKDESSISANCHVVINNGSVENPCENTTGNVVYPIVSTLSNPDLSEHLAICFSKILKSNNPTLIANIIDTSGKVIISIQDLAKAVAFIIHKDYNDVRISYIDNDFDCCSKINPIHSISKIEIGTQDFNLNWNKKYNSLLK